MVQHLWPGYYAHDRSPLRACRRLNHCLSASTFRVASSLLKIDEKEEKKREGKKRRKALFQGLEGSVLRNVFRVNVMRCTYELLQNTAANEPACRSMRLLHVFA